MCCRASFAWQTQRKLSERAQGSLVGARQDVRVPVQGRGDAPVPERLGHVVDRDSAGDEPRRERGKPVQAHLDEVLRIECGGVVRTFSTRIKLEI